MINLQKHYIAWLIWFFLIPGLAVAAGKDETAWNNTLKQQFFGDSAIVESSDVIELTVPYRAENPALVPIKVNSGIKQSKDKYIKRILLVIDKNPVPFVGDFEFTPESGMADIAMRVRVNTYSYIRAIAEMDDGKLYMNKKFVKASGGCSAPLGADLDAAMKRLGKMKFRLDDGAEINQPALAQLLISHPNITGMQMDQVTRHIRPAHYVEKVKVFFDDKPILTAKTDIAISADPNFRFYFIPQKAGDLRAEITDTTGASFSQTYHVEP